ncbi:hypothetical protein ACE11G_01175 [Gordonia sp. PS3]|uniref:hypothetical protein n=1 Tax=Gordonia TaxID=2053 RepID=UPI0007858B0B|nr:MULTISPECIES: hypothetical protein [Gordonia]KXT57309.1 hypothetical protein Y710_09400 [Gordonia sp. QH-12]WFN92648.1 hypothetical protein P5P27_18135 [Gordonia sihwensis]
MTLLIAGTAGADPAGLAAALAAAGLREEILVAGSPADAASQAARARTAVLAIDSSMPACEEEDLLLAELAAAGLPTALVACRVDAFPAWPKALAETRRRLDPQRGLPVFATSAALASASGSASGVPELARWCRDRADGEAVPRAPARAENGQAESGQRAQPPSESVALIRADRLAGLRAGIVASRAEAIESLRAATSDVHRCVPDASAAPGFTDWLPSLLDALEHRVMDHFAQRLDQVRAAAVGGLAGGSSPPSPPEPFGNGTRVVPRPQGGRRTEDVMVLLLGASMGFGIGRMVIAPTLQWAGLGIAGTVLTLLGGVALAAWVVSVRRASADRARLERWAAEVIASRRLGMEHRIGTRAGAAEAQFTREVWNRTRPARV